MPILSELHARLIPASAAGLPKSQLGEATQYVLSRWDAFTRYTAVRWLSIDNNRSERTLRAVALGWSNWMDVGSADAGHWATTHCTVVGVCRNLGIDLFAYLRDVFPKLHALGTRPTDVPFMTLLPDHSMNTFTNAA